MSKRPLHIERILRIVKRRTNDFNLTTFKSTRLVFVVLVFIVSVFLAACTPKQGNSLLKVFFDGVPDKSKKDTTTTAENNSATGAFGLLNRPGSSTPAKDTIAVFYHRPFKEKACGTCHKSDEPGSMAHFQNDVCFSCHTNFKEKYAYIHGPVAAGECTSCHLPHSADNKELVRRKGQDLCLYCHTKTLVMKNSAHADIGNSSCLQCHNAHGGKDRLLLTSK